MLRRPPTPTLFLHDALPISLPQDAARCPRDLRLLLPERAGGREPGLLGAEWKRDRKSTRLNSSHVSISYAVFCLKKKKPRDLKTSRRIDRCRRSSTCCRNKP